MQKTFSTFLLLLSSCYHLAFGSADHCVHYYDLRSTKQPLNVFKVLPFSTFFLEKALYICSLAGPPQGCVLREVLEQHGHSLCLDRQPAQAVEHQPDSLCQVPAQLLSLIFHRDLSTFTLPGANNILIWYFLYFRFDIICQLQ